LEASNTFGHALDKDLTKFLSKYDLKRKVIVMLKMKDLNNMTITLKFVVSCDILGLKKNI
jgi:hypothetical protein